MYNKHKFNKVNDKKVLHKVKKQWVTVSLTLLMMIGGGAVATHISALANTTNNNDNNDNNKTGNLSNVTNQKYNQPKLINNNQVHSSMTSDESTHNILNQASQIHQSILAHAMNSIHTARLGSSTQSRILGHNNTSKSGINSSHGQINTTYSGNTITINNKIAQQVNSINKLRLHEAKLYHGYVYNRINSPFQTLKIKKDVLLHSSVDFDKSYDYGALRPGTTVRVLKLFKQFGHYGNYLRYEIKLSNKRNAFITGNNHFVSYVIPDRVYKYYQKKANKLGKGLNYKNAKRISYKLRKLNKQRSHSFRKYANLYEMAFNTQQNHKYPVVVNYGAEKHSDSIPTNDTANLSSNTSNDVSPVIVPVSTYTPSMPVQPAGPSKPSNASTQPTRPSNPVVPTTPSKPTNQPVKPSDTKFESYNGLNYKYNPTDKSVDFVSGKVNVTTQGSFLNNVDTPSDIRNADIINFNNIDLISLSNMNNMLANDPRVKQINLGNNFNTQAVTDMGNMFKSDTSLQQLSLGTNFNTSNVTNMDNMFADDGDLTSLVLPQNFNTTNINNTYNNSDSDNMSGMFHGDSDLSSITIESPNTKFNSNSDLNTLSDKPLWINKQNVNDTANLGDGESHVGTWIYKSYANNTPANDVLPKNINMKIVNSDVKAKVISDVKNILNGNPQKPTLRMNLQSSPKMMLGAISNDSSNALTSNSVYTQLAQDVANGANNSWNESDLTLSPANITGPADERGYSVFTKTYFDSDMTNKELLRSDENSMGLIKINGIGTFRGSLETSDFLPNSINGDWISDKPAGDPDYVGIHTTVKYSGPISVSNTSTNSDIAKDLVDNFNLGKVSKDQLKLAKGIGLGYKYHNGNLYGILVLGPNTQINSSNTEDAFEKVISDINNDPHEIAGLKVLQNSDFHNKVMPLRTDLENHTNNTSPSEDSYSKEGLSSDTRDVLSVANKIIGFGSFIADFATMFTGGVATPVKIATSIVQFFTQLGTGASWTTISHDSDTDRLFYGGNIQNMLGTLTSIGSSHVEKKVEKKLTEDLSKAADKIVARISNKVDAKFVGKITDLAEDVLSGDVIDKTNYYVFH